MIEKNIKDAKEILERMNQNQKINYHTILTKLVDDWKKSEVRPKILIHSCCAPCSTYTLEFLSEYADVTVLLPIPIFILKLNMRKGSCTEGIYR